MVVQEFKRVGDAGEQALKRPAVGADEAAKKLGVMRSAVAGIGLQLQDVAVQMQSGTSMFTIVAQQAPQMASAFGAVGVAVGTTIAIVSALAGAFFGLKTKAAEAGDLLSGATSDAFLTGADSARTYLRALEDANAVQREFLRAAADVQATMAGKKADELIGGLGGSIRNVVRDRATGPMLDEAMRGPAAGRQAAIAAAGQQGRDLEAAAMTKLRQAAETGNADAILAIAASLGLDRDPEAASLVTELVVQARKIQVAALVRAGDQKGLRSLTGEPSKFDKVKAGLEARLAGASDRGDGIFKQAMLQAGGKLEPDEEAELRRLADAIEAVSAARTRAAASSRVLNQEDAQATRLIEELQRRLGKFEDSRDAFVKRFTNQIDAAIAPAKMAELSRLAGELYDLERQTDIINRQAAARNRQRQYADSVFGDLQRNRNMERDAWERSPLAGVGAARGLMEVARAASDAGAQIEQSIVGAFRSAEDAMVSFITTGKADFKSLIDSMLQDLARLLIRQTIIAPFAGFLGGFFPKAPGTAHTGGMAGEGAIAMSMADYGRARRFHGGGMASDEIPAVLQRGEVVVSRTDARMRGGGQPIMISIDARGATDPAMIARIAREQARRGVVEGLDQANRRRRGGGLLTA